MSYEYKEEILLDIGPEPNCNYESESNRHYDKTDELDHVYAQAAKADEYEVKAKRYDHDIPYLLEIQGLNPHYKHYDVEVAKIIQRLEKSWQERT